MCIRLRQVTLDDGAVRSTLATTTDADGMRPLPTDAAQQCPDFALAAHHLREAVAMTGKAYAGVLDTLFYGDEACATTAAQCFTDAVRSAEGLEHFHVFEPSTNPSAKHMLDMHSDIGLFLVMTPAELFSRSAVASGAAGSVGSDTIQLAHDLVVELPDGRIVTPVLPAGALLVMNGEGLTRWMAPPVLDRVRPYTPLHEVLSSAMNGGVRAWFGRMFMPPASARLQATDHPSVTGNGQHGGSLVSRKLLSVAQQITFGEYRQHTYITFREGQGNEASAAGCSPSRRMLTDEGSCRAAGEVRWLASGNGLACIDIV